MANNQYRLITYEKSQKDAWDACLAESRNGNFLCSRSYLQYHESRFNESSFLVEKDGKCLGIFPCTKHDGTIVSHGGVTYAGLIYPVRTQAAEVIGALRAVFSEFIRRGVEKVIYKAVPGIFQRYPCEEDLYALHHLGARLVRRDLSSAIKLSACPTFSDSRKNTIRKAIKEGLVVRETGDLASYHGILTQVLLRHGSSPTHTLEELRFLHQALAGGIRLFGAYRGDDMLAGVLVYDFGRTIHTQYMANSDQGRKIGAIDLILSELIHSVFKDRDYLSFGISTTNEGRELNDGLLNQKEGFGGRGIVHDFYEMDLRDPRVRDLIGSGNEPSAE